MRLLKGALLLMLLFAGGCWDRTEINDLAFVTGTALDVGENGNVKCTLQIAIPTSAEGGRSRGEGGDFFVITAEGKNGNEIHRNLQVKSSRKVFLSHRSVVYISERLARQGLQGVLDIFIHDPRNRLKTYLMVVKGAEARDVLQMKYPLKQVPIEAVKQMQSSGEVLAVTLRDYYMALEKEGTQPVIGVVEPDKTSENKPKQIFKFAGAGVFNELKLAGLLDENELQGLMWTTGKLKFGRISAYLPDGKGEVGLIVNHADRKIVTRTERDAVRYRIKLTGLGSLAENNSALDIGKPGDLKIIKKALEDELIKQVREFIFKVQKVYKSDCIGFGNEVYKSDPKKWAAWKDQWVDRFPKAEISIEANLTINGAGMVTSTLGTKDKEKIE